MCWFAIFTVFGLLTDFVLMKYLKSREYPGTVLFSLLCCLAFTTVFDNPLLIAKGCIFSQLLITAGYIDLKTRELPDALYIPILLCGFIQVEPLSSLEGAAILFAVLMSFRLIFGGIGGGDIKLMTSCGWVLGLYAALGSAILGFFLFFIVSLLLGRKLKSSHPLAPFLAIGCITAFLIF